MDLEIIGGLRDVTFRYPAGPLVLDAVSLDVVAGRNLGIIGPSGCGKSTLLALLAGLKGPTAGNVEWAPIEAGRHPLSMVFQTDTLLPWLTVKDNVTLWQRLNRRSHSAGLNLDHLFRLAHLQSSLGLLPYQLSGGMRRRTAVLSAVAPEPRVLLLDEPFSSLDEPTRLGIHQDVYNILRESGITAVLVTHDLAEAISLCDEVLILTNRPATIAARHAIPFGESRDMLTLRKTDAFLRLYGTIWEQLSEQIKRTEHDVH